MNNLNKANQVLNLYKHESIEDTFDIDKSKSKVNILDYKKNVHDTGNRLGYVSIVFRDPKKDSTPSLKVGQYALNCLGDGWFRVPDEGLNTDGYGLCITDVKLTTKEGTMWGSSYNQTEERRYKYYKAIMTYIPSEQDDETTTEKEPIFIIVRNYDGIIDDVLDYIKTNNHSWRP